MRQSGDQLVTLLLRNTHIELLAELLCIIFLVTCSINPYVRNIITTFHIYINFVCETFTMYVSNGTKTSGH